MGSNFFSSILLSLFFILIINFTIDKNAYFRKNKNLNDAVSSIVAGRPVAELQFHDERILQKYYR